MAMFTLHTLTICCGLQAQDEAWQLWQTLQNLLWQTLDFFYHNTSVHSAGSNKFIGINEYNLYSSVP
jgi:hypothetical protein